MFNAKTQKPAVVNIKVQAIPADFYAGANPVIKFKKVEKEVLLHAGPLRPAEKALLDKNTAPGAGSGLHPASVLSNRKMFVVFGLLVFVLFLGGTAVYYTGAYRLLFKTPPESAIPAPGEITLENPPANIPENEANIPPVATSTAPEEGLKSLALTPLEYPSMILGDSADLDEDRLTDKAEEIFNTDPSIADTDSDSYSDSHEIFYLYNPAGKEPHRLIAAGTVLDYANPAFGYKIYYPADWALGSVDAEGRDILFSALTGENIEIRVFDLFPGQTFADWFGAQNSAERFDDLIEFESYFKDIGQKRKDGLVYYFYDNSLVYVLLYHTLDPAVVNYRSVLEMMARSFRTPANNNIIQITPAANPASGL